VKPHAPDEILMRRDALDLAPIRTLLLDADGNLFPSEEPAFVASTKVVNRMMAWLGASKRYEAEELRLATLGKNFRTTAADLATAHGTPLERGELEQWVAEEKRVVTEHLRGALTVDAGVVASLTRLSDRFELATVSSSALSRLDACFGVTGLGELLSPDCRFSAEDSLSRPTSKPDPAIYTFAAERLGLEAHEGLAVEDSVTGAESAVAAGIPTVGNVCFVAPGERDARVAALEAAGVAAVVSSWSGLESVLAGPAESAAGRAGQDSGMPPVTPMTSPLT
jgi:beta-phosphoglucomutase-like phosphatase (HAD superfamily)